MSVAFLKRAVILRRSRRICSCSSHFQSGKLPCRRQSNREPFEERVSRGLHLRQLILGWLFDMDNLDSFAGTSSGLKL
jgi:hypothetical protein